MVLADRPLVPLASQSRTAFSTVYASAGVDTGFQLVDDPLELVLDDLLGSAPALDSLAVALAVVADLDGSRVAVFFQVDRGFVLADDDLDRLPPASDATCPLPPTVAREVLRRP